MIRANTPQVAIVVLTWNQCRLTLDCLASLAKLDYPQDCVTVIVVDNGSIDGTTAAVLAGFPDAVVLENAENLGFAAGNNVGLRHALNIPVDYVMLLNNDTVVDAGLLNVLTGTLESDPTIGMVGPKMLYFDRPDVIWCAGNRVEWRNGETVRLQAEQLDAEPDAQPREVDFITACAICVRRQVVEQIGLLDPRFFIYYEETDWCTRAREAGWRILYQPSTRIWHKVSAAMGTTSPATDYYMKRNVLLFLRLRRRGLSRLTAIMRSSARTLASVAAYTLKSDGGKRRPNRDARLLALRDALRDRWGKMGSDVEHVCYGSRTSK